MDFKISHSLPGRVRIRYKRTLLTPVQAGLVKSLVESQDGIVSVEVNPISGSILIHYQGITEQTALSYFRALDSKYLNNQELLDGVNPLDIPQPSLFSILSEMVVRHYLKRLLPFPIRKALQLINIAPRLYNGAKSIVNGKVFCADVLDATALGFSFFSGDIRTAGSVSFLLSIGEVLEEYIKRKSYDNLAHSLLNTEEVVNVLTDSGQEIQVQTKNLKQGDRVICRIGGVIPADGTVVSGLAMVNQSSMTGEPLAVEKKEGSGVFASTIVEDGEIVVSVKSAGKETRINQIVSLIDNSQALKAASQVNAERIANHLVKYNFLLAAGTYFATGNFTKAMSTLLVDYSCAMKLSAPICVLSAMRDSAQNGIIVKGGKFLELISEVDTFVFDKTGTLTEATPKVSRIVPLGGRDENEVLKMAACLEEHFPHSLARAVVLEAQNRNLVHEEEHTKVEYVLAHGVASSINGKKLRIGSAHFIFDDEKIPLTKEAQKFIEILGETGDSILYFSEGNELAGLIAIKDFIRQDSVEAIKLLKQAGVKHIVMITGDGEKTAQAVAREAGITEFYAQTLPDQKVAYVKQMKAEGRTVAMVGDGINDAPALSAADIGIAMGKASSIAGQTADIMLPDDGLSSLPKLMKIGRNLKRRIKGNNDAIIGVNSMLILGGLANVISPSLAALLHNASTVAISMSAMRRID
ncbi:MAG: heavy metal translocating P-type ATPase [Bacteroidales bacterium]|nr:heavy metal translocating P-type ATPase [Bacteroidales bacterium]